MNPRNESLAFLRRLWHNSSVQVWLERFALGLIATAVFGLVILNTLKFDAVQRWSLGISLIALSIFVGQTLHLQKKADASPTPSPTPFPASHAVTTAISPTPEAAPTHSPHSSTIPLPHLPNRKAEVPTNPKALNVAPGGFAISGGTVVNPVVNNAPPARTLNNEDRVGMIRFLAQHPSRVAIYSNMNSPESYAYAKEWAAVLRAAGWKIEGDGIGSYLPDEPWKGIQMTIHGELTKDGETFQIPINSPAATLGQALVKTGNNISGHRDPGQPEDIIELKFGLHP